MAHGSQVRFLRLAPSRWLSAGSCEMCVPWREKCKYAGTVLTDAEIDERCAECAVWVLHTGICNVHVLSAALKARGAHRDRN